MENKSSRSATLKGFGRRQAYESLRRPNPRAASGRLWVFRYSADPGADGTCEWQRQVRCRLPVSRGIQAIYALSRAVHQNLFGRDERSQDAGDHCPGR